MVNLGFNIDTKSLKASISEISTSLDKAKEAAKDFDKSATNAFKGAANETEKTTNAVKRQKGIVESLENRYQRLENQLKKATSEKTIGVLNNKLKDTREELKRLGDVGVQSMKKVNKEADTSTQIFNKLKGAAVAAFSVQAVIMMATEIKELTDRTNKATSAVRNYFKGSQSEINNTAKSVFVMSSVLQQDEQTIAKTANSLAKGFGENGVNATNTMSEALMKAGGEAEELLSWFQEYPANMNEAGLSMEQFAAIAVQSSRAGIFSDYGISTIEEGMLRLREMTPATQDALNAIELKPVDVQNLIQEEGIFSAIQLVSERLGGLDKDSQVTGQAIADIFGGAGEKAGYDYIASLSKMSTELKDVTDNSTELTKSQREFSTLVAELGFQLTSTGGVIESIYTGFVQLGVVGLQFVKDLFDKSKPLTDVFKEFYGVVSDLWTEMSTLAEKVGLVTDSSSLAETIIARLTLAFKIASTPVKWLYEALVWVISGINDFIDNSEFAQSVIKGISDRIEYFSNIIKNIPAYLNGFLAAGKTAFSSLKEVAKKELSAVGDMIVGIFTFDKQKIKKGFSDSKSAFNDYGTVVADAFNKGFDDTVKTIVTPAGTESATTKTKAPTKPDNPLTTAKKEEAVELEVINKGIVLNQVATGLSLVDETKKTVAKLNEETKKVKGVESKDIFNLEEIKAAASSIVDIFSVVADANLEKVNQELEANQARIDSNQETLDSLKSDLDRELALNEQGFASNVQNTQRELAEEQKKQKELEKQKVIALKQQEAAQKAQERVDSASQISSILTAIAYLIKNWSELGPFGYVAGLANVGVLLAGFVTAKTKAKKLRKGKTGFNPGIIEGASHEAGGVPFGNYEVEGGEYHSITPKDRAKEELPLLEAIRTGNKKAMFARLVDLTATEFGGKYTKKSTSKVDYLNEIKLNNLTNEVYEIKRHLKNQTTTNFNGSSKVIMSAGSTKIIN